MRKSTTWLLMPLILLASFAAAASNNEITLKNGDKLSGTVVSQDDDTVIIETVYAGRIVVDLNHVESIVIDPIAAADASDAVTRTESDPQPGPKPTVVPPKPSERPVRLFGGESFYGLADGWEGNANIGFSYTTGNTRTSTMTTGIRAVKLGRRDKLTVYARSLWYSNRALDVSTTQNAVWGGARYDRNYTDNTFLFGSYDFERDRPRKLNFRSVLGGGIGHHLVKNDRTEIDLLAGAAWNRTWQTGNDTDTPELLAGNTLKHKLNGRLRFQQTFTAFQNATDRNEYRFIFDSTLTADLTKRIGWHVTIGDRFNNDPAGNSRKNDFLFTTGIRWNFGVKK